MQWQSANTFPKYNDIVWHFIILFIHSSIKKLPKYVYHQLFHRIWIPNIFLSEAPKVLKISYSFLPFEQEKYALIPPKYSDIPEFSFHEFFLFKTSVETGLITVGTKTGKNSAISN